MSVSSAQTVSGNDLNTILLTGLNDFGFDEVVAMNMFEENGIDYGRTVYNMSEYYSSSFLQPAHLMENMR